MHLSANTLIDVIFTDRQEYSLAQTMIEAYLTPRQILNPYESVPVSQIAYIESKYSHGSYLQQKVCMRLVTVLRLIEKER